MSERDAREMLRELLPEALAGANGQRPVRRRRSRRRRWRRVHRPSTWGAAHAAARAGDAATSDADLERFVPRAARPAAGASGEAIRAGRLRFTLGAAAGSPRRGGAGTLRVERGAVTERKVEEAAQRRARGSCSARARS